MKKSKMILAVAGMALAMVTADVANAQRGGNRDNPGGRSGGSNRGDGGNFGRQNSDRPQNVGQALRNQLQNRIREEARGSGNQRSDGNRRFDNQPFNQRRGGNNFSQQPFGNRNYGTRNNYSNRNNNNNNRFGSNLNQRGRYQSNPLAQLIVRQFPEARRILSPRGPRYSNTNRGAFYRNNNRYYYFPDSNFGSGYQSQPNGVLLSGNVVVDGGTAIAQTGGAVEQQSQPVEVQFGEFAYTDQLSEVLTTVLNDLCLDMHYNYQQNANFAAAYREAYAALTEAKGLRDAQQSDDRDSIKQRLKITDSLLHSLEPQVQGWTRTHQKQIGEAGMLTKLEIAGDVTHHMMYDAGISEEEHDQSSQTSATADADNTVEQAPAPQ